MLKRFFIKLIKFAGLIFSLIVVGALSTFITLRLFTSGDEVSVPDLAGKDAVEALQILRGEGLQMKIHPQKRFSDQIAAEKIVAQRPNPDMTIKRGRSVEVYISLGPERAVVPELIGQTNREAGLTLQQRGLTTGKIIHVSDPTAEGDEVLAQYPPPGTEMVGATKSVHLLVNSAVTTKQSYVMPDVIGKDLKEVTAYFRSSGFSLGAAQLVEYPGVPSGTIVKQNPPAGYRLTNHTLIGLYYSK